MCPHMCPHFRQNPTDKHTLNKKLNKINDLYGLWRRGRDSNPRDAERPTVFKTAAFDHSATSPTDKTFSLRLFLCEKSRGRSAFSKPDPVSIAVAGFLQVLIGQFSGKLVTFLTLPFNRQLHSYDAKQPVGCVCDQ